MKVIPFYLYHSWFAEEESGNVRVCMCLKFSASKKVHLVKAMVFSSSHVWM